MPIDHLIVNSPYEEPRKFWDYLREERRFELKDGRRSAGYVVASSKADTFDDPGLLIEIPLVFLTEGPNGDHKSKNTGTDRRAPSPAVSATPAGAFVCSAAGRPAAVNPGKASLG